MVDVPGVPLAWLNCVRFLKAEGRIADLRTQCDTILRRTWPRFQRDTRRDARKLLGEL